MSSWEKISDICSDKKIYQKLSKRYILYHPCGGIKRLVYEDTGVDKIQEIMTDFDLGWHLVSLEDNKQILVSDKPAKKYLTLAGKIGFEKGCHVIDEIGQELYSYKKARGAALTLKVFNQLSEDLLGIDKTYWLADQHTWKTNKGMFYITRTMEDGLEVNACSFFATNLSGEIIRQKEHSHYIIPIVYLPQNTYIKLGEPTKDGFTKNRAIEIEIM